MRRFKNLLYVLHGQPDSQDGLKQALSLARNNSARLTVQVLSPQIPDAYAEYNETYRQAIKSQVSASIEQLKTEIDLSEFSEQIIVEIASYNTEAIGIIKSVLTEGYDLVIKESTPVEHRRKGFSALDMQLLRDCPCAVWLCRPINNHRQEIQVAVAIDPQQEAPAILALSKSLLTIARTVADDCKGELNIVSCRDNRFESELADNVFIKIPKAELAERIERDKQDYSRGLENIIASSGINDTAHEAGVLERKNITQLIAGKPDRQIPAFVAEHNIDILVMGTVARTGIAGFFIGNTAENIVQQINCSLLTIKPKGFISSVKL